MAMTNIERKIRWRARHPRRYRFMRLKERAKVRRIPLSLEFEDIVWPTHCPVLGIELDYSNGSISDKGESHDARPSFDRRDNTIGYVLGNVDVMSYKANAMKRNATLEELKSLVLWLEQKEKGQ